MTFVRRRNRLTTHFSERIPVVKRRISEHIVTTHVMDKHVLARGEKSNDDDDDNNNNTKLETKYS